MRYEWGRDHALLRDGETVGTAEKSWWRERATVSTDAGTWSFRALGWKRLMITGPDGIERLGAVRTGWLSEVWTVTGEHGTYEVRPAGILSSRLVVRRAGAEVGRLTPARWWTDRPALELSTELSLGDAVLLLWVGYVIRQRTTAAGSGGATAAV
ncbi:hypothetical protein [Nocardioides sp. CER19]|uniref:hypothetical protein n=1 Tax=Nocardioides sp. CER19 TaxID=3038538 RepID=UPI00244C1188|nr:hypothetical protein [Nocardioides sp. CER19]MDH2416383.1 hypothetical protein [Nocardioides sp. CER19]